MESIEEMLDGYMKFASAKELIQFKNYRKEKHLYQKDKKVLDWLLKNGCEIRGYSTSNNAYIMIVMLGELVYEFGTMSITGKPGWFAREYLAYLIAHGASIKYTLRQSNFVSYEEECKCYETVIDGKEGHHADGYSVNIFSGSGVSTLKGFIRKENLFKEFCKNLSDITPYSKWLLSDEERHAMRGTIAGKEFGF